MKTKEQRLEDMNNLIKVIASFDRKFLSSHSDNYDTSAPEEFTQFSFQNGKLFLKDKYTKIPIPMKKGHTDSSGFSQGGTMWSLCNDFKDYILKGYFTNHKHGYGGLYCPHWAYKEESMEKIREFAAKIGYLTGNRNKDMELGQKAYNGEETFIEGENKK